MCKAKRRDGLLGWAAPSPTPRLRRVAVSDLILVDTSVWIDHFRHADEMLVMLLKGDCVVLHPFVLGEIALGHLRCRADILLEMRKLPSAIRANDDEVFELITRNNLFGCGIGYVDAHLLASVRLASGSKLWTNDRRLAQQAERFGLCARVSSKAVE